MKLIEEPREEATHLVGRGPNKKKLKYVVKV
jgi:hypothetical protein